LYLRPIRLFFAVSGNILPFLESTRLKNKKL
jgi:hypothetical protein